MWSCTITNVSAKWRENNWSNDVSVHLIGRQRICHKNRPHLSWWLQPSVCFFFSFLSNRWRPNTISYRNIIDIVHTKNTGLETPMTGCTNMFNSSVILRLRHFVSGLKLSKLYLARTLARTRFKTVSIGKFYVRVVYSALSNVIGTI